MFFSSKSYKETLLYSFVVLCYLVTYLLKVEDFNFEIVNKGQIFLLTAPEVMNIL